MVAYHGKCSGPLQLTGDYLLAALAAGEGGGEGSAGSIQQLRSVRVHVAEEFFVGTAQREGRENLWF